MAGDMKLSSPRGNERAFPGAKGAGAPSSTVARESCDDATLPVHVEKLWVINGVRYDMTSFLDRHPGGRVALELGRGRDCTELFESYHSLTDNAHATLEKFRAADQSNVPAPMFDFQNTPLFSDLKREVRAYFKDNDIDPKETTMGWVRHGTFFVLFLVSLLGWYHGAWWSLMALPWSYWLGCSHMMHSGSHFALSHKHWLNVLGAYLGSAHVSIHDWNHQHVIGHHSHVNMHGLDPDLEHFAHADEEGPGFRLATGQRMLDKYRSWRMALPLQAFFTTFGPSLINQYSYWTKRAFFNVKYIGTSRFRVMLHIIGRLSLVAFLFLIPAYNLPWWKAIPFALLPLGFHGYIYYIFSQVSHATEKANGHGDSEECVKREWAVHQILHSVDYETDSPLWTALSIGLNAQTIHHVFPQIATAHFGPLSNILATVCERHNVPYVRHASFWDALVGHLRHIQGLNDHESPARQARRNSNQKTLADLQQQEARDAAELAARTEKEQAIKEALAADQGEDADPTFATRATGYLLMVPLILVLMPVLLQGLLSAPAAVIGILLSSSSSPKPAPANKALKSKRA